MKNKKLWIGSVFLATFMLVFIKIKDYALAPLKDKDCSFKYPKNDVFESNQLKKVSTSNLDFKQKGGFLNDASCLNKTLVQGVVDIRSEDDIKDALKYAKDNKLKVSLAGSRHSMGGQVLNPYGLVLDMNSFNQISFDEESKIITVQSGALWADVQKVLDDRG